MYKCLWTQEGEQDAEAERDPIDPRKQCGPRHMGPLQAQDLGTMEKQGSKSASSHKPAGVQQRGEQKAQKVSQDPAFMVHAIASTGLWRISSSIYFTCDLDASGLYMLLNHRVPFPPPTQKEANWEEFFPASTERFELGEKR